MNYINKQNIEEYIFDYYEGNLSDIQKAEVMSFIHQHQEYESLFAQWAMTYTLKDEEPEKYGMEHSWMRKETNNFQWKKWTTVFAVAIIGIWGIYNWHTNLSSKNDNQVIKPTSSKEATIIPLNKVAKTIDNKKLNIINNNNTGLQNNIAEEAVNLTVTDTKDSIENNIVLPKTIIENESKIATESKLSSTDSSEANTFSKEAKAEKKAKKKKIKLHLNFKQHDEFKPVNENF